MHSPKQQTTKESLAAYGEFVATDTITVRTDMKSPVRRLTKCDDESLLRKWEGGFAPGRPRMLGYGSITKWEGVYAPGRTRMLGYGSIADGLEASVRLIRTFERSSQESCHIS